MDVPQQNFEWQNKKTSCLNSKIIKLQERALRLAYADRQSAFEEPLNKDKSVTIHHRNWQVLATELYKVRHELAPGIMNNSSKIRIVKYNFRNDFLFATRYVKSFHYGSDTLFYLGRKLLDLLLKNIKDWENILKWNVKLWSLRTANAVCV